MLQKASISHCNMSCTRKNLSVSTSVSNGDARLSAFSAGYTKKIQFAMLVTRSRKHLAHYTTSESVSWIVIVNIFHKLAKILAVLLCWEPGDRAQLCQGWVHPQALQPLPLPRELAAHAGGQLWEQSFWSFGVLSRESAFCPRAAFKLRLSH